MLTASVILAVLATNLLELSRLQGDGIVLPPYELSATVTHIIPTMQQVQGDRVLELGLADDSGSYCLKFLSGAAAWPLAVGDTISLSQTNATRWSRFHDRTVRRLAHREPAPARLVTADAILHGAHDYQLVTVHGLLRSFQLSEFNARWTCVVLKCGRQNLYASTPSWPGVLDRLNECLHSEISLEGLVLPRDGSERRHIGRVLHFIGPSSIKVLRKARNDFSLVPELKDIGKLPPSEIASLPRHRVRGTVVATWDTNTALLRTDDGKFCRIDFLPCAPPRSNTRIEAIGYPECDLQSLNLSDAQWRRLPDSPAENRAAADGARRPNGDCDRPDQVKHGSLVRLRGTIVALPSPTVNSHLLHLNCDEKIIPVNSGEADRPYEGLCAGMVVEVTGICVNEVENYSPSRLFPCVTGFFVVLRTASDIRIISRPSWWTPARTWSALGILLASLVAIFLWNVALRRIATRKGRELFREQVGHVKADLRTEERTRLAVELHDTLAQNLTGVSMEIEAANDLRGTAPQPMLDHLGIAAKALKSCRDELRNCLWDLGCQALEELDMTKAVLRTLQPHVNDSRLAVRFNVPRARLSDNTAHALLRVIRELVVNAIRHGNASSIKVAGTLEKEKLRCSVSDNGRGFDAENAPGVQQGHFGLQGIRERIDGIGGTFEITSAPGRGTKAVITLSAPTEE